MPSVVSLDEPSVIHGILRQPSLVDYPGQLGVLMFTSGCNFRCGFCHNVDLLDHFDARTYSFRVLHEKLVKYREEWVQAVTVTGGEPTLHAKLPETIRFLKDEGFLVKLDTNGCNPLMIKELLPFVDYFALDLKCALEHYPDFVKYSQTDRIRDSFRLVIENAKDYEFRTTVLENFHTDAEILAAAEDIRGAKRWLFQPFVPHENLPDEALRTLPRTRPSVLEHLAAVARTVIPGAQAR